MKVLAGLVGDRDVFGYGYRSVRAEYTAALGLSGDGGQLGGRELERLRAPAGKIARSSCIFVARFGVAGHLDAAQHQRLPERGRSELGGIFDGHRDMETRGGRGTPGAHHHGAGAALEAGVGLIAGLNGRHTIVDGIVVDIRRPCGLGCAGHGCIGRDSELVGIFVEGERGDGCAVAPLQLVPAPTQRVGLVEEVGVVADHVAVDGAHSRLLNLLGKQVEDGHGCGRGGAGQGFAGRRFGRDWSRSSFGFDVRIMARAHGGIADAEENDVAVQRACGVHIAVGDHEGGPGERVDGQ